MTRTALLTTTGLVLGLAVFTTGCKKNKEVAKPKGEVEIVEFCTGSEYNSDSKHFRSTATGESQDREIAKKKARSTAESRIARTVSATIKAVTDNYVSSTEFNNREEATESFNELARTVVDQELRGAIASARNSPSERTVYVPTWPSSSAARSLPRSTTRRSPRTSASWPNTTTSVSRRRSKRR